MTFSFFFYKAIKAFLVPPGLFVTVTALLCVLALRKPRRKLLAGCLLALSAVLWFLSAPLGERALLAPLEKGFVSELPPRTEQGTVMVVLSGGSRYGKPPSEVEPGPYTCQRLAGAYITARQNDWPVIMTGAFAGGDGYISTARSMERMFRDWGFNGKILLEESARTTWENMALIKPLLQNENAKSLVVVTSAFHMKRSLWCARKLLPDMAIFAWPSGFLADARPFSPLDVLPASMNNSLLALREHAGLVAYRLLH